MLRAAGVQRASGDEVGDVKLVGRRLQDARLTEFWEKPLESCKALYGSFRK